MTGSVAPNAFTVDVEDWYQSSVDPRAGISERVIASTRALLALLGRAKVRGTFFVQGMVAERFPDLVREIRDGGHEVGTHGHSHRAIDALGEGPFREELARSIDAIERVTKEPVLGHRGPDFSLRRETPWALDAMLDLGLRYDSTVFPFEGPRYGFGDAALGPFVARSRDGARLLEFPVSVVEVLGRRLPMAGGGYFRHYPYPIIRWGMRRMAREGRPANLYFHPYELDPDETWFLAEGRPLGERVRFFRQGLFRDGMAEKLERLVAEFPFAPAREVLGL